MNRVHPDPADPNGPVKIQSNADRPRWGSNYYFLIATIGSVVGFSNLWRFPFIFYRNGGAIFLGPYFIALFLVGIPMLLLELSLGQKYQRGIVGVMKGLYPRAVGIAFASIFAVWWVLVISSTVLSWTLYYLALSFKSPLYWSTEGYDDKCGTGASTEYFFRNVLKYQGDDCVIKQPKDTDEVSWFVWL